MPRSPPRRDSTQSFLEKDPEEVPFSPEDNRKEDRTSHACPANQTLIISSPPEATTTPCSCKNLNSAQTHTYRLMSSSLPGMNDEQQISVVADSNKC